MTSAVKTILQQFKCTEDLEVTRIVSEWSEYDQSIIVLETNKGNFVIFKTDYLGDFNSDVMDFLREKLGVSVDFLDAKSPPKSQSSGTAFEKKWDIVSKYIYKDDFYYIFLGKI